MSDFATPMKTVTARKEHDCMAYKIILESGYGKDDFEVIEWCKIKEMKEKGGKIRKGEEYYFWSGFYDGYPFAARCNKDMYDIVTKFKWWEE